MNQLEKNTKKATTSGCLLFACRAAEEIKAEQLRLKNVIADDFI
jgi:hypothetical protein